MKRPLVAADPSSPPRAVTGSATGVHVFAWSPAGDRIALVEGRGDPPLYLNLFPRPVFLGTGSVWTVEAASGRTSRLIPQEYPGLAQVTWPRRPGSISCAAAWA